MGGGAPGSREERALEGMCLSSHHSIPECCICSERLPENLLIWQPCSGECPSRSPLHPCRSPPHPASPEPCSVPSQPGPGGHTRATKLRVEGVKYSQMKQNAAHSGKIIPAFSDNAGFQLPFGWETLMSLWAPLCRCSQKLQGEGWRNTGKRTETTPKREASAAEPWDEQSWLS